MSSAVPPPRRTIVLRANRDTLVLLVTAAGLTVAIGYAAKNRPAPPPESVASSGAQAASGGWTGQLAQLEPAEAIPTAPAEPLSSAALTVPSASMALPAAPRVAAGAAKPHPCDAAPSAAPCPAGRTVAPTPSRRPAAAARPVVREAGLIERLNPLTHLPDAVTRPFASAGDAIAGWVRRF